MVFSCHFRAVDLKSPISVKQLDVHRTAKTRLRKLSPLHLADGLNSEARSAQSCDDAMEMLRNQCMCFTYSRSMCEHSETHD